MGNDELAPITVEIIEPEDLDQISVLGKIDTDKSGGVSFLGKVDAVLGMASNVLDAAGRTNLCKVVVPEGYTLRNLVKSAENDGTVRAFVRDSNGIAAHASLRLNGVSLTQVASVGLSAAAMAVGQAYMT